MLTFMLIGWVKKVVHVQYLFQTSYLSQTLHAEFCIIYKPKSEPLIEQYPTTLS
jgi:hypothetical protein